MSGFINRLLSQWIEVIEWLDPSEDTLVYRFPVNNQEIKMGAQLIVFPEAFVPGYPVWMWRLRPGGDLALTERLHALLRANAVSLAADDLAPLREAAKARAVTVVCGIDERDADFSGGTFLRIA